MKNLKSQSPVDYLMIVWRRKWFALATLIVVAGGTAIFAMRTPNVYRSDAMIGVEPAPIPQDYVRSSDRSTPVEQINAVLQQLQGRAFLQELMQENSREFPDVSDKKVKEVTKSIQVLSSSRNTCQISFVSTDAAFSEKFLNDIVNKLTEKSKSSRQRKAVDADKFVDDQLTKTKQDLDDHEAKIRQFKAAGELPEQSVANLNILNGYNSQLIAVENALAQAVEQQKLIELRAQSQSRLGVLTNDIPLPATGSKSPVPGGPAVNPKLVAKEAELAALMAKYTSNHPDVLRVSREVEELKKKSATELSPIPEPAQEAKNEKVENPAPQDQGAMDFGLSAAKVEADSIKKEIDKRKEEKATIEGQIKVYKAKLNLPAETEKILTSLLREYDVLKQQYNSLTGKKFQTQMTRNLEERPDEAYDTYKVIDHASTAEKSFPDRRQLILMGIIAGFALGIGISFGLELIDTTIGGEEEATTILGLPVLVTVSEIPRKKPVKMIGPEQIQKSA